MSDLFEAYEYLMLETEQRAAWLLKTFGSKLAERFMQDYNAGTLPQELNTPQLRQNLDIATSEGIFEPSENPKEEAGRQQRLAALNEAIAKRFVEWIMGHDPTPNKIYARWIVNRLLQKEKKDEAGEVKQRPERLEDVNDILVDTLAVYQQAATSRRVNGNIDEFKSFSDLFKACEPFLTGDRETSGKKDKKAQRDTSVDTKVEKKWSNEPMIKQANVIYDSDNYIILVPKTHKASRYFGKATNWCTTTAEDYHYKNYSEDGPLYIIMRRKDGVRWQFHFPTGQFCDTSDHGIDLNKWIEENHEAFEGLGPEKFFPLVKRPDHFQRKVDIKWFPPELLETFGIDTLASIVDSKKELKALPAKFINDPKLLALIAKRYFEGSPGRTEENYRKLYQEQTLWDGRLEVAHALVGKWANNEIIDSLLPHYPVLLKMLPEKFQTDARKTLTAENWNITNYLKHFIPDPWPADVSQVHYDNVVEPANELPEQFRTNKNMGLSFALYPEYMSEEPEWAGKNEVFEIAAWACNSPTQLSHFVNEMPEKFRTYPPLVKLILERVRDNNKADEREWRDGYLSVLVKLPESVWPKNASKIRERMLAVADDFYKLPEHYQTPGVMTLWVKEHPDKLPDVPAELLTRQAVIDVMRMYLKEKPPELPPRVDDYDPAIIKPEWFQSCLEGISIVGLYAREGFPPQYATEEQITELLEAGIVSFRNKHFFTPERLTPRNIALRFAHEVKLNAQTKDLEVRDPNSGRSHTVKVPDTMAFRRVVSELPDNIDMNMAAMAATATRALALSGFPKEVLNAEVLTKWVSRWNNPQYGPATTSPAVQDVFELFPKEAYTAENAPLLVKHGFLKKIPAHLHSDEAAIAALTKSYSDSDKTIPWDKVTPEVMVTAIRRSDKAADGVAWKVRFDKQTKKIAELIQNPDVGMAFIDAAYAGADKDIGYKQFSISDFRGIYDDAKSRINWTQAHYDKAAGQLVTFAEIPTKFLTDDIRKQLLTHSPLDIEHMDDATDLMNKHDIKYPSEKQTVRALSRGVYHTDNGWHRADKLEHHTVKGTPGFYTIASVHPRGHALFIFDKQGKCLDALLSGVQSTNDHNVKMLASEVVGDGHSGDRSKSLEKLKPYRMLFDDAYSRYSSQLKDVKSNWGNGNMTELGLHKHGDRFVAFENLPRMTIDRYNQNKGDQPEMTYVQAGEHWKGGKYWFFPGDSKKPLGCLVSVENGRGFSVEQFFAGKSMKALLDYAMDFTEYLREERAASGQSKAFKDSDLYTKMGIRGPGGGHWYCLLDEVLIQDGPLRMWKSSDEKGKTTYCVSHDEVGTLVQAKRWKDGTFGFEVIQTGKVFNDHRVAIGELLAKATDNIDTEKKAA